MPPSSRFAEKINGGTPKLASAPEPQIIAWQQDNHARYGLVEIRAKVANVAGYEMSGSRCQSRQKDGRTLPGKRRSRGSLRGMASESS